MNLIDNTKFAISSEETRYYLNGIFLHVPESNKDKLRAVATDRYAIESAGIDFKKCTPATEVSVLISNFELAAITAQSSPPARSIPLVFR